MMRRLLALGLALGAVAFGCSTDVPRPKEGPPCVPLPDFELEYDGGNAPDCNGLDGYELFRLNDFESVHNADFYFNNDRTALQTPAPDSMGLATTAIPGGRCAGAALTERSPTLCDRPETAPGECIGQYVPASWSALEIRSGNLTNNGAPQMMIGGMRRSAISASAVSPTRQCWPATNARSGSNRFWPS